MAAAAAACSKVTVAAHQVGSRRDRVFGEGARSRPEDIVPDPQILHVRAGRRDGACHIRTPHPVPRFGQSGRDARDVRHTGDAGPIRGFTAAARTRTSTSPSVITGIPMSLSSRTSSGEPYMSWAIAFMPCAHLWISPF